MGRTVAELESALSVAEWNEWIAFNSISPIGDDRLDHLVALLCQTICGAMGAKKRGGGRFQHDDFLMFDPEFIETRTPLEFMRHMLGHKVSKRKR
jgi:hypothetical protein